MNFPLKWYRIYDSSDSTILPEDCYESDVLIPRFFWFYDFTSRVLLKWCTDYMILPEDGYESDVPILWLLWLLLLLFFIMLSLSWQSWGKIVKSEVLIVKSEEL